MLDNAVCEWCSDFSFTDAMYNSLTFLLILKYVVSQYLQMMPRVARRYKDWWQQNGNIHQIRALILDHP